MTIEEKLSKTVKLADTMYYAAQMISTDASHLKEAMEKWWQFKNVELKESEDERIRERLIEFFKDWGKTRSHCWSISISDILAWLEKQGTPNQTSIWKHWKDGIAGNGEGKLIYLIKNGNDYHLSSCLGFECDYIELSELDKLMLEKQGEQKETLCTKCRKEQPSHSCQDITALGRCAVEHEQKPTDKVEHKFKVGDEIKTANKEPLTITKIDEKGYWSEDLFICGFDEECIWDLAREGRLYTYKKKKGKNFQ